MSQALTSTNWEPVLRCFADAAAPAGLGLALEIPGLGFFLEKSGLGFRDWGFDRIYKVCRVPTAEKSHRVCMVESLKLGDG